MNEEEQYIETLKSRLRSQIEQRKLQENMIEVVRDHYNTCRGKPAPLQALKREYGPSFNFKKLGLGNYGSWMAKNEEHFRAEQKTANFLEEIEGQFKEGPGAITEEDLLRTVKEHFDKSEMFSHRRHVLNHVRRVYGKGPFGKFGYGSFREFLQRHSLDMGIAKRSDFRRPSEWRKWSGRVDDSVTEDELIRVIRNYYKSPRNKGTPLDAMRDYYGKGFRFQKTGLGNYQEWVRKHEHLF